MNWIVVVFLPWYMGDAPHIVAVEPTLTDCQVSMTVHMSNLYDSIHKYKLDGEPLVVCLSDIEQIDSIGRME